MKKISISLFCLCLVWAVKAQQADTLKEKQHIRFRLMGAAGLTVGQQGGAFVWQAIAGLHKGLYAVGIGAGSDNYTIRSVPLFIHLQRDFSAKRMKPFVYADGGINLPARRVKDSLTGYRQGVYLEAGAGYAFSIGKAARFVIAGGYQVKSVEERHKGYQYISTFPRPGSVYDNHSRTRYTYNRLGIKLGFCL